MKSFVRNKRGKMTLPVISINRAYRLASGEIGPKGKQPLKWAFQLQLMGTGAQFKALASILAAFAKSRPWDSEHHHHYDVTTYDGNVFIEVIIRKDDIGDACWRIGYPQLKLKAAKRAKRRGA
jgi:hypothetical protein